MTGVSTGTSGRKSKYLPNGERRITLANGIGFGIGDFFGGGSGALTGTYLSLFLTTYAGLSIAQAQSIQGVATILSAVTAIIIGGLSDSMYRFSIGRKLGRRRFFLLLGAPLLLLGCGMWIPGLGYWFYFASFFIWIVTMQIIMIPYATLPSEMTTDFNGRTILSTTRMFISGLAGSVIPLVGAALLNSLGKKSMTYTVIGIGFILIFVICVLIAYFSTWERKPDEVDFTESSRTGERRSAGRALREFWDVVVSYLSTLRVRAFQQHMLIYLLGVSSADVFANTFVFFTIYGWRRDAAFASLLLSLAVIWLPVTPLQGWMFAKLGANGLYSVTFGGCIATLLGMYGLFRGVGSMPVATWTVLTFIVFVLWLFFKGLIYFTPWQIFPFVPDVDEMITRKRREGVFSSMMRFLRTLTQGFAIAAIGWYLQSVGFDATLKSQSVTARNGLAVVCIGWVIVGLTLAWIISLGLKLNKKNHKVLMDEMDRLRSGGSKSDVTPETRKVVESLTGVRYERCWPEEENETAETVQSGR